jgi:hypothetical protein
MGASRRRGSDTGEDPLSFVLPGRGGRGGGGMNLEAQLAGLLAGQFAAMTAAPEEDYEL